MKIFLPLFFLALTVSAQIVQPGAGGGGATASTSLTDSANLVRNNASNTFSTGTQDLSGATHTLPALKGLAASKPATCTQGEQYFATDATAGQNLYFCTATNTWTQQIPGGGEILVSEQVLVSAQASVTFSSLPSGYRDLKLVVRGRTDKAATHGDVLLRFNSDTGANYDFQSQYSSNTASSWNPATAATSIYCGSLPAASSPTNEGSTSEITISNFSGTTFEKSLLARAGHKDSNSNAGMTASFSAGFWRNTAAITSVTVLPDSGNFIAGSIISLYADGPTH